MSEKPNASNYDFLVIGGGPAGSTAAIYTARAGLKTLVIDKGVTAGALGVTAKIANYPGIEGEIPGAELVRRMRAQAESFGARYVQDHVAGTDLVGEVKTVFANAGMYSAPAVLIATGSMQRSRLLPGEEALRGRGVSYCAVCDAAFFRGEDVAVAGSSDEAAGEALYLARFAARVHLLSPTPELRVPPDLLRELESEPEITIHPGTVVNEILGNGKVEGVRVTPRGVAETVLPVRAAFLYLQGGRPATDFLLDQLPLSETGCLIVDRDGQTAIPGVYAAGDVLCNHIKQVVIAAAEGAQAAIAVEKYLRNRSPRAVEIATTSA